MLDSKTMKLSFLTLTVLASLSSSSCYLATRCCGIANVRSSAGNFRGDDCRQQGRIGLLTSLSMKDEKGDQRKRRGGGGGGGGGGGKKAAMKKIFKHKWRLFNVDVTADQDPGKDFHGASEALLSAVNKKLGLEADLVASEDVCVIRKSFDARKGKRNDGPSFTYVVDVDMGKEGKRIKMHAEQGKLERVSEEEEKKQEEGHRTTTGDVGASIASKHRHPVAIIGCGPAGLFAALRLAEEGVGCVIYERGQPVEERGRDIGAMIHRRLLDPDSNICYGEGGAGTWSDGKLTTRIGRNSEDVRWVLKQLVRFGAPDSILVDGKPHLGTDRLVRILKTMRNFLESNNVVFKFGTIVKDIKLTPQGSVRSLVVAPAGAREGQAEEFACEQVIMAAGHSARELYEVLATKEECLQSVVPKPFAVGFRIEHPQHLINSLQLGDEWASKVNSGKGKIPVADYRLATQIPHPLPPAGIVQDVVGTGWSGEEAGDAAEQAARSVYSFCMCPGGQIVCTSVNPEELCVNGMSFSRRQSQWANSALVASVDMNEEFMRSFSDLAAREPHGQAALGGLTFQRSMEREAAIRGGGDLVCPVQRVTDFLEARASRAEAGFPQSSYRLGTKPAALHDLYPQPISDAITRALVEFDRRLPGFITPEALLHGVETRTSSAVRITRSDETLQCVGIEGLFPCGEGAGYAGGIVSSAVDGLRVATAVGDLLLR